MSMTIEDHHAGDVLVVKVAGHVTALEGVERFSDALRTFVQRGQIRIVLDVGSVTRIDSMGLGAMLRTHVSTARRGGATKLLRVRGHVRDLLEVTRLLPVFEAYDDERAAIESFGSEID